MTVFLIHSKLTIINLSGKNNEIKYSKIYCIHKQDAHILTQNGQNYVHPVSRYWTVWSETCAENFTVTS